MRTLQDIARKFRGIAREDPAPGKMPTLEHIARRVPLVTNGAALLGLAFALSGFLISRYAYLQLAFFVRELAAVLPFSITPDLQQRLLVSLPLIVTIFISLVSSIAALLIGVLWIFSGLLQAFRSRRRSEDPAPFENPDLAAESLRRSEPLNWVALPSVLRLLKRVWPSAPSPTPVAYEMLRSLVWTVAKLLLGMLVIAFIFYILRMIPALVRAVLSRQIELFVPSADPLYALIGLLFVFDALIGVSLIPFRQQPAERGVTEVPVRGRGDPHVLLALLEEGCRLLTPAGKPERHPVRLEAQEDARMRGTLVESFAQEVRSLGRPAAYVCLFLTIFLLVTGFSRLIHFQRSISPMPYSEFLSFHLLSYGLDVAFSLGLVFCGLHFGEWALKLFGMRRFRSSVVFCSVTMDQRSPSESLRARRRSAPGMELEEITWKRSHGVDAQFALWAKQPETTGRFKLDVAWADVISESATAASTRHVTGFHRSPSLDDAVKRILLLPFHVGFEREAPRERPTAGRPDRSGEVIQEKPEKER